jgi:hypothetical protein
LKDVSKSRTDVVEELPKSRDVSSSRYANDKGFSEFKVSDARFDNEQVLRLPVSRDVSKEGVITRRVGDVELGLDIKGKVTPELQFKGFLNVGTLGRSAVQESPLDIMIGQQSGVAQIQDYDLRQVPIDILDLGTVEVTEPVVTPRSRTRIIETVIPVTPPVTTPIIPPVIPRRPRSPETPPEFKPPVPFGDLSGKKRKGRVKLQVRRKGVFETRGIFEDVTDAFSKGKDILRSTARASFRVVDVAERPVSFGLLPKEFTMSKREPNVVVQKREARISSFGEKQEITYKGIQASKMKRRLL